MKNITLKLNKAAMAIALLVSLLHGGSANAQTPAVVLPSNPQAAIYATGELFNTAMINYGNTPSQAIWGIAWTAGSPIYIQDVGTTHTATITPVGTGTVPDIIIGNLSGSNLTMAVAYYDYGTNVNIDFYDITGVGTPALAITYNSTASIPVLSTCSIVHLDLIAEHPSGGLPPAHKFIITWEDGNTVNAANGDLSSYSLSGTSYTGIAGTEADVAAIQRSGYPLPTPIHDLGLVTYIDLSGDLMYTELDFTVPVIASSTTLDNTASMSIPRIDAIDDYDTNANASIAQWKVAAQAYTGSGYEVRTYDNLLVPGSGAYFASANAMDLSTCCGYATGPYNHYSPVVAVTGPWTYSVFHWTELPGHAAPADIAFSDPIDRTTSYTLTPNDYYWVNGTGNHLVPSGPASVDGQWPISISSSVNYNFNGTGLNLFAWSDVSSGSTVTMYKISNASSFSFREGAINNAVTNAPLYNWAIYPNPATNELTIRNATGSSNATYSIIDVAGCQVLQGAMSGGSTAVDISNLAPGTYLVKVMNGDNTGENIKFVKK